jgi:SPP1 gp7 family putative phage head morphogenesis protein
VLGVNIFQREPWLIETLKSFVKENVALIMSIKDDSVRQIEGIVRRGVQGGTRHEEIAKQVRQRYGVTRNRARLIARDQVAKLNGNLTMRRQQNLGIKKYIWRTSADRRVRPTHRDNEGREYSWNDPPGTGHPGEDFQCRCTAEAVFEDVFQEGPLGELYAEE